MKRKIIYIAAVVLFAIIVAVFGGGCASQEGDSGAGQEIQQEESLSEKPAQSEEALVVADANGTVSKVSGESADGQVADGKKHVTITINCATIFDNLESFDKAKVEILPEGGVICPTVSVEIQEGETVFDVLLKTTQEQKIHMEYVSTPLYKSNYIEGIGNIYEIDCGPLSGWMYKVNSQFPNYGCGRYVLEDGDQIEWIYTCDLGRDIGGDWNEQNK